MEKDKKKSQEVLDRGWRIAIDQRKGHFYQYYVAKKMKINRQYLSAMERGERGRNFENFLKYCDAMNLDAFKILGVELPKSDPGGAIPILPEYAEDFRKLKRSAQEVVIDTIYTTIRNLKRLEEEAARVEKERQGDVDYFRRDLLPRDKIPDDEPGRKK